MPAEVWPERLLALFHAVEYGAREELLQRRTSGPQARRT
jgi:hypothetical protein